MTDYEKNIEKWLKGQPIKNKNGLLPGGKVSVSVITDDPEKFVSAVKKLIDYGMVSDIEFSSDYQYVIRLAPTIGFSKKFDEQYQREFKNFKNTIEP